jgi:hypothetical protein
MPSWLSVNARHVPTLHFPNCGHQLAYCSSQRWYMSMEKHGGIILTGEAKELRGKPVPVPLFPPQIAHSVTRAWTRASTVKSRPLTAWAMARPRYQLSWLKIFVVFFSSSRYTARPPGYTVFVFILTYHLMLCRQTSVTEGASLHNTRRKPL